MRTDLFYSQLLNSENPANEIRDFFFFLKSAIRRFAQTKKGIILGPTYPKLKENIYNKIKIMLYILYKTKLANYIQLVSKDYLIKTAAEVYKHLKHLN